MIKLSLEKLNKNLLFVAILSLFYKKGNFYNSFIPKPFEIFFVIFGALAAIDIVKNRKIKDFFNTISKNIIIAVFCLLFSILFGWVTAVFLRGIPSNFNMVLEFGTFIIGLSTFLIILFYSRDDEDYAKKYFYALFFPIIFIIVVIFPTLANYFGIAQDGISSGNFLGFTSNANIISKILLIPAMFFIAKSLFEKEDKLLKFGFIFISAALVALLFWAASRGALLSLVLGTVLLGSVFAYLNFNWKKIFLGAFVIFVIFLIGFFMTPYSRKQVVLNRTLNKDTTQISAIELKNKPPIEIVKGSSILRSLDLLATETNSVNLTNEVPPETRLTIWKFYLKKILKNPFGFGPNTHMESRIKNSLWEGYISSGPHNSYLQIFLWGGLLGLSSFLYILYSAFNNLKMKLQANFNLETLAIMAALFALSIAIMFDDSLSLYHFWVILALALRR